jgi:hypothetical protein
MDVQELDYPNPTMPTPYRQEKIKPDKRKPISLETTSRAKSDLNVLKKEEVIFDTEN